MDNVVQIQTVDTELSDSALTELVADQHVCRLTDFSGIMLMSLQGRAVHLGGEIVAEEFTTIFASENPAILVRKDSSPGSVVVAGPKTGQQKPRVDTGQGQGSVLVQLQQDQSCIIYGTPPSVCSSSCRKNFEQNSRENSIRKPAPANGP